MIKEIFNNFWFSSVNQFLKTRTFYALLTSLVAVGVYVYLIIFLESEVFQIKFKPNPTIFSLLGLVLGLLLVFRTNTAYDRWWEGRRMIGALVNNTRNLALKLASYLPHGHNQERQLLAALISNYGLAMKEHLRQGVIFDMLVPMPEHIVQKLKEVQHVPNFIALQISYEINSLYTKGILTREQFLVLDKQVESLTDIVGACERIRNSPIPFSYSIHLKKFIFLYILILPFGLTADLGYWTILIVIIIFYAFTGLEVIGEEIEDPFGKDINDLPTDAISIKIAENVKEILLHHPH